VREVVALSTCNRTELYAAADDLAAAEKALVGALVAHSRIDLPRLECARYAHREDRAAAHLFRVAASLDSMVLGESEIQGQVAEACELADEEGASGPLLDRLFRAALETGKRVRTETGIARGPTSVSAVAVRLAREALADLPDRRALLLGAGQVAEATAAALAAAGVRQLVVANRTVTTARELAARVGGRGVGFDHVDDELAAADIVISSTDAPHVVLGRDDLARAIAARPGRPMVLVDIAVPRDLDAAIAELPGVLLYDIDDLERVVEATLDGRLQEAERAEAIVVDEVQRFSAWRRAMAADPAIAALRARAETIRVAELARLHGRWESLGDADRARIEALTRAIVSKLLHEPSVRLRAAVESGDGVAYLDSLRHLFDLPPAER
jgi:glutamyl-tRNA reductase